MKCSGRGDRLSRWRRFRFGCIRIGFRRHRIIVTKTVFYTLERLHIKKLIFIDLGWTNFIYFFITVSRISINKSITTTPYQTVFHRVRHSLRYCGHQILKVLNVLPTHDSFSANIYYCHGIFSPSPKQIIETQTGTCITINSTEKDKYYSNREDSHKILEIESVIK